MAKDWKKQTRAPIVGMIRNPYFVFTDSFDTGTTPTLLDSKEAQKVVNFIRALMLGRVHITTGNPLKNLMEFHLSKENGLIDLQIKTALINDLDPYLGNHLNLEGYNLDARDVSGTKYQQHGGEGLCISGGQSAGIIRLLSASSNGVGGGSGFKDGGANVIWQLPNADGSVGQVLSTDGSSTLSWVTNGGGGSMTFDFEDENLNSFTVSDLDTVSLTSFDGSVDIDCSVSGVIDLAASGGGGGMTSFDLAGDSGSTQTITNGNTVTISGGNGLASVAAATDQVTVAIDDSVAQSIVITDGGGTASGDLNVYFDNHIDANRFGLIAGDNVTIAGNDTNGTIMISTETGGGGGSGTVTSIDTSSGIFVDVTGGPITTTGTITGDLSATGTADSTTFLRGDNTWAVPSGGSGMTSFDVSDTGTGSFTVTNGNTIIMKSVAVVVDDYPLQVQVGTDLSGVEFVNYYLPYTPIGVFYISDGTTDVPQYEGDTIHFESSDGSITWETVTGGMDAIVDSGPPPPSDERLKENIQPVGGLLEKVEKLKPVEFDWNEEAASTFKKEGHEIGLIAQDVEKIFPDLVGDRKGFKTVDYEKLVPMLVDCIKDLSHQVRILNEKVDDLEFKNLTDQ